MEQIQKPWQSWQRHYTLPKIKVIQKWWNSWCRKVPRWNQGSSGSCGDPYWYDGATCHAYDDKEKEYPTSFLRNRWWQLSTQNCFWKLWIDPGGQRYTYIAVHSDLEELKKWKKLPNRNMQEPHWRRWGIRTTIDIFLMKVNEVLAIFLYSISIWSFTLT